MHPIARRILEAFDELNGLELEFAVLAERAGSGSEPTSPARAALSELLEKGWLRPAGPACGGFARTEAGRLAIARPLDLTLYTRPGCHLCEEAKTQMAPLVREFGASFREVNIDRDPELRDRYAYDVPVLFLGARKIAKHRVDPARFRQQLERARREAPHRTVRGEAAPKNRA